MLFLVALVLRLGPSVGDLPHIYDYDEPLFMTFEVGRMYSEHSLEPSGYAHPALYKDLSVAALAIVGSVAGWDGQDVIAGPGIFGDHIVNNPMPWFTLRALAAVLGAMAVFLAWDAARRFGVPNWAAAAAAGFGAVAPLLVGVAPRIAPDGFSVFFAILVVWTLAWALQRPSLRRQALLGVTIGLVASAKYNGAPFALLGLVLPVVATRSWQRRVLWLVAAGGAAALAFAITNPYALVHFGDFIDELRTQNSVYSFGLTGDTGRSRQFNARTLLDNAGPLAFMALASVPLAAFALFTPGFDWLPEGDSTGRGRSRCSVGTGHDAGPDAGHRRVDAAAGTLRRAHRPERHATGAPGVRAGGDGASAGLGSAQPSGRPAVDRMRRHRVCRLGRLPGGQGPLRVRRLRRR